MNNSELEQIAHQWSEHAVFKDYCPRCGDKSMDENHARNAVSRVMDIAICDVCGTMEALNEYAGMMERNGIHKWYCVQQKLLERFIHSHGKLGSEYKDAIPSADHRLTFITPDVVFDHDDDSFFLAP